MEKQDLRPIDRTHTSPFMFSSTGESALLNISHEKIDMEMFAHLEYLSEVKERGIERLKEIRGSESDEAYENTWRSFRSFIRQAKLFYFSAEKQDPSISALNYFYAFENLVKAYCCLYFPEKVDNKIRHGLITEGSFSDNFEQEITIRKEGIMPIFYELKTGKKIENDRKIQSKKLTAYCTDISYENELVGNSILGKPLLMKAVLAGENPEKVSLVIAISASISLLEKYTEIKNILEENFNLVDIPQSVADTVLQIPLDDYRYYTYFQSKVDFDLKSTPLILISSDFYKKFFPFVSFYPRDDEKRFNMNIPIEDTAGNGMMMDECMSIFILMFYMSELVRYHPKLIQDNLSENYAWLMERFTVNTPQTFLRYMVNLIRGRNLIFK